MAGLAPKVSGQALARTRQSRAGSRTRLEHIRLAPIARRGSVDDVRPAAPCLPAIARCVRVNARCSKSTAADDRVFANDLRPAPIHFRLSARDVRLLLRPD